jgi:hypothetical protein
MRIKIAARRAEIPARSRTLIAKALAKFDEALECAPNFPRFSHTYNSIQF